MEWGLQHPETGQSGFLIVGERAGGRSSHLFGAGGVRSRSQRARRPPRAQAVVRVGEWGGRGWGCVLLAAACPAALTAKDTGAIQHLSAAIQDHHNKLNVLRCVNTGPLMGF